MIAIHGYPPVSVDSFQVFKCCFSGHLNRTNILSTLIRIRYLTWVEYRCVATTWTFLSMRMITAEEVAEFVMSWCTGIKYAPFCRAECIFLDQPRVFPWTWDSWTDICDCGGCISQTYDESVNWRKRRRGHSSSVCRFLTQSMNSPSAIKKLYLSIQPVLVHLCAMKWQWLTVGVV